MRAVDVDHKELEVSRGSGSRGPGGPGGVGHCGLGGDGAGHMGRWQGLG